MLLFMSQNLNSIMLQGMGHNSIKYLSTLIQAMQLGFADSQWYCADPAMVPVPVEELLSDSYAAKRRLLINPNRLENSGIAYQSY